MHASIVAEMKELSGSFTQKKMVFKLQQMESGLIVTEILYTLLHFVDFVLKT
jgi:hypothetical protein